MLPVLVMASAMFAGGADMMRVSGYQLEPYHRRSNTPGGRRCKGSGNRFNRHKLHKRAKLKRRKAKR